MKWTLSFLLFFGCSEAQRKIASDSNSISIVAIREDNYKTFVEQFKSNPEKLYEQILEDEVDARFFDILANEYFSLYKLNDRGLLVQNRSSVTFYQNQILLLIKDSLAQASNIKLAAAFLPQLPPMKQLVEETQISLSLIYNERGFRLMQQALEREYFLTNTEAMSIAEGFFKKNYRLRPKQSIEILFSAEKYFVPVYRKKFLELIASYVSLVNDEYFINTLAKRLYDYYPRTEYKSLYQRHIALRMNPEESRLENDLVHRIAKRTTDLKIRDALIQLTEEIPPPSFEIRTAMSILESNFKISYWNILVKALERNYFYDFEKPRELVEKFLANEAVPTEARLRLLLASSRLYQLDKNIFIERVKESFTKSGPVELNYLKKFIATQELFVEEDFESLIPKKITIEPQVKTKGCGKIIDAFMSFIWRKS